MGYVVHQISSKFVLKRENQAAALAAVKQLHHKISKGLLCLPRTPYVDDLGASSAKTVLAAPSIFEALAAWGWTAIDYAPEGIPTEEPGDIVELDCMCDKLGRDWDELFAALAPFVENESHVSMTGEDGAIWRWFFKDRQCFRQEGHLAFDGPLGKPLHIVELR